MNPLLRLRRLRRLVLAHRRPLAALCAAFAVLIGLQAASPAPPPSRSVPVAAHDLAAGDVLDVDDLTRTTFTPDSVPAGVLTAESDMLGRTTAAPVRAGEPLTDVRLVSGSLLKGYPGLVAQPLRVGDGGAVDLLRVGDRVDVLAADPQGRSDAVVVAQDVAVLALPRAGQSTLASGGLVVLAVHEETARRVAAAAVSHYLSVVIRQ